MMNFQKPRRLESDLVLVMITVVWGVTFSVTKQGLAVMPPLLFLSIRFLLAFAILMAVFYRRVLALGKDLLKKGILVGVVLFAGFATQTMGIRYTTASKAAFITGLSVILVPFLSVAFLRKKPSGWTLAGSLLAFAGMAALSVDPAASYLPSFGDFLVFLCAIAFALHIILTGRYAPSVDPVGFTTVQVGVAGLACGVLGLLSEPVPSSIPLPVWGGLAFLAVFATLGTTLAQTWAQRHTTPTHTAIIFTLEPVFAAIFAYFILGEVQNLRTLIGGALIILGILVAELLDRTLDRPGEGLPPPAATLTPGAQEGRER